MSNRALTYTLVGLGTALALGAVVWLFSLELDDDALVLYSGRSRSLVEPLIRRFEEETGLRVRTRYGDTAQLAVALREEGQRSRADLFWAQDAGALGVLERRGLLAELPGELLGEVPAMFRSAGAQWVGTSGRARVIAYSTQRAGAEQIPASVFDLTADRYEGRVGWAPTNGSFQAFVTAMREAAGEERTLAWLEAMRANGARAYANNTAILRGIANGEIDFGLTNHYYLHRMRAQDADFPADQTWFEDGDIGNLINVAGIGRLAYREHPEAERFIAFLLSEQAQRHFEQENHEYPTRAGFIETAAYEDRAPELPLENLDDLEGTLALMRRAGLF